MTIKKFKQYDRLDVKLIAGMVLLTCGLMTSFVAVLNMVGKTMVLEESARLIEQTGESAIATFNSRSQEVAALTLTLGEITMQLPKNNATFEQIIPQMLDFNNDTSIAGGTVNRVFFQPRTSQYGARRKGSRTHHPISRS